jgi:hypothetical protein
MNQPKLPPRAAAHDPGGPQPGLSPAHLLRLWFGFPRPVSLMALKYAVNALPVWALPATAFSVNVLGSYGLAPATVL